MSAIPAVVTLQALFLGRDAGRYARTRLALQAAGVYAICVVLAGIGVLADIVETHAFVVILAYDGAGALGFYLFVRLGFDARLGWPQFGVAQMGYGLVSLGIAYILIPALRGALCMLAPLVLVFGAFVSDPRYSRLLGWLAVLVFAGGTLVAAHQPIQHIGPATYYLELAFAAVLLPTTAGLAGLLSKLRAKSRRQNAELAAALEKIRLLATTDELTGLPNRRHFAQQLAKAIADAKRGGAPLSLCLIDLDHFKAINDRHGHAAGDEVLQLFARQAVQAIRESDCLARWGGEEFALLLPNARPEDALEVVERLRQRMAAAELWARRDHLRITFSAGIGLFAAGETGEQWLQRIDAALYEAKQQGRNRTTLAADRWHEPRAAMPQ